jgi:hypothetical protein
LKNYSHESKQQKIHVEQKMSIFHSVDWEHVYRDWRFVTVIAVLTVIVVTYLLTGNMTWHPRGVWYWSVPEKVGPHAADLPPVTHP